MLRVALIRTFLDHINSLYPTTQFTFEMEQDGSLLFLQMFLTRTEEGSIDIEPYHKLTHSYQYLQYNSHYPQNAKMVVASYLINCA